MQYVLPFCDAEPARPRRPERLFLALFPDTDTVRRIKVFGRRFLRDHHLHARLLPDWRFHLSLHPVGDFRELPEKYVFAARRAAAMVQSPPIAAELSAVRSFAGIPAAGDREARRPLVLLGQGPGLYDLHHRLGLALRENGLCATDRFTPHVTLSYGPNLIPEQMIPPIDLPLGEFALIHSRRGLGEYRLLGRWPLLG